MVVSGIIIGRSSSSQWSVPILARSINVDVCEKSAGCTEMGGHDVSLSHSDLDGAEAGPSGEHECGGHALPTAGAPSVFPAGSVEVDVAVGLDSAQYSVP